MSTKTALKAAKAAIGARDWEEAKTQATAVLEKEPQSYFAYLFLGRANDGLSRFDEAEKAYYDATKIKPEDPQAWLGLRSMYEGLKGAKVDENIDVGLELAQIYMNLYVFSYPDEEAVMLNRIGTTRTSPNPPSTSSWITPAHMAPRLNTHAR
jgi:tetratricopeptide (TPR) repeat protein